VLLDSHCSHDDLIFLFQLLDNGFCRRKLATEFFQRNFNFSFTMLQGRANVVPSRAAVCTVSGTKTRLGTVLLLAAKRDYLESAPFILVTTITIASMWLQETIPRYGVEQMLIRCEMDACACAVSDRNCHCHRRATVSISHRHNVIHATFF
jgi:hypothetical protein